MRTALEQPVDMDDGGEFHPEHEPNFRPSFMQAAANLMKRTAERCRLRAMNSMSAPGAWLDHDWNQPWLGGTGSSDDLRTTVGMAKELTPRLVLTPQSEP